MRVGFIESLPVLSHEHLSRSGTSEKDGDENWFYHPNTCV